MSAAATDWSKSLQELDGADWGDPKTAETPVIGKVLALRRKPLASLTDGKIRLAIGQRVGLPFILQLAIIRLRADPLIEGDCYPGDVLAALIRLDEEDWNGRNDLRTALAELFGQAILQTNEAADAFRDSLELPTSSHSATERKTALDPSQTFNHPRRRCLAQYPSLSPSADL